MTHSQHYLDQIRQRLALSQVASLHVKLRRQGNEWTGSSPFKATKQNTLFVNDESGFFRDFATEKQGDAFDFIMEVEGLSYPQAVERLARLAGLPVLVGDA